MDCYIIINQFISTILLKKKPWNYQKRNSHIMIVLSKWGKWQYEYRSIFDINCKKKKLQCTVHVKHWVFLNWFEIQANFPAVTLKLTPYTAAQTFLPSHSHLRHLDSVSDRQARCKFVSPLWPPPIYRLD